jgi:hypothetical protein
MLAISRGSYAGCEPGSARRGYPPEDSNSRLYCISFSPRRSAIRRENLAEAATDDGAADLAERAKDSRTLPFGRLRGAVTKRHVRDLVRHDAGHFAFSLLPLRSFRG